MSRREVTGFCTRRRLAHSTGGTGAHAASVSGAFPKDLPFVASTLQAVAHVHALIRSGFGIDRYGRSRLVALKSNVGDVDVQLIYIQSSVFLQMLKYGLFDGFFVVSRTMAAGQQTNEADYHIQDSRQAQTHI